MKTIVATAYAVNPYKGSEDGMGWNFVKQIARFNKVIAITRENNRPAIEQYMAESPDETYSNIQFEYFDLPYWLRFWKKGGRGAMLYYILWQIGIVSFIKKRKLSLDIAHNLNFHNDWTPSFLWRLGKPFVWGFVGHHPLIPAQYLSPYKMAYWLKDRATWLVKQYFWRCSISLHLTKTKADHILCMNEGVPKRLRLTSRYSVSPSVATDDFGWIKDQASDRFTVISAGRFVPLKGFDLTIASFAEMLSHLSEEQKNNCQLTLVGSGPEEQKLKDLIEDYQIAPYVKMISWIERAELMEMFKTASTFLFPSHEGAGMVVAEALSFGLPIVCLDNEGPGQFINADCGVAIPHGSYQDTIDGLAKALTILHDNPDKRRDMRKAARARFVDCFHWDRRGEALDHLYATL